MGKELQCKIEHGNVHDIYAVAVIQEDIVVGHLPRNISTPCHLFLCKGGVTSCVINGSRQYSADLIQGGLQVLCHLVFQCSPPDLKEDATKCAKRTTEGTGGWRRRADKRACKKQAPVQKQLEPGQRSTQKHCELEQPNIQNTENSSYQ